MITDHIDPGHIYLIMIDDHEVDQNNNNDDGHNDHDGHAVQLIFFQGTRTTQMTRSWR